VQHTVIRKKCAKARVPRYTACAVHEVLTAVSVKSVFWNMTPCSVPKCQSNLLRPSSGYVIMELASSTETFVHVPHPGRQYSSCYLLVLHLEWEVSVTVYKCLSYYWCCLAFLFYFASTRYKNLLSLKVLNYSKYLWSLYTHFLDVPVITSLCINILKT
jgi:hypothetical protein